MLKKSVNLVLIFFLLNSSTTAHARGWRFHHRHHMQHSVYAVLPTAHAALLWNITSNQMYFSKSSEDRIYPASTTKIMTVMLALENLKLDQYVTVSQRATEVPQTNLGFKAGEQYMVKDLIYACLLKSANDAAGVLAEAVAGSQEKFADLMNQKALALGARNTHFVNPHGLPSPSRQYSTAHDMAILFKEAMKDPFFQKAISLRYRIIYSKDGRRLFLKAHNKCLFLNWKHLVMGKTGYTRQAQSCFVGYFKKGNDIVIVDVFGCSTGKRWDDIKWIIEHYGSTDL